MQYGCPNCGNQVVLGDLVLGRIVACPKCMFAIPASRAKQLANEELPAPTPPTPLKHQVLFYALSAIGIIWGSVLSAFETKPTEPKPTARAPQPIERAQASENHATYQATQPTPEPSTLALIGASAVLLPAYMWRRRRRHDQTLARK